VKKKKGISETDRKIWQDYTKNPNDLYDKDINKEINSTKKKRFKFDLHGYSLESANKKTEEIINKCFNEKYAEILLITGKGIHSNSNEDVYRSGDLSKIKNAIPDFISSNKFLNDKVSSISNADSKDGGEGALIIKIKKL
tara:strand:+ start:331 stop:750 length:420 start_codon:yes stop_codon:yes gene_type:complete